MLVRYSNSVLSINQTHTRTQLSGTRDSIEWIIVTRVAFYAVE